MVLLWTRKPSGEKSIGLPTCRCKADPIRWRSGAGLEGGSRGDKCGEGLGRVGDENGTTRHERCPAERDRIEQLRMS